MGILGIFTWGGTIAGFLVVLIGYPNPDFGRLLMGAALGYLTQSLRRGERSG